MNTVILQRCGCLVHELQKKATGSLLAHMHVIACRAAGSGNWLFFLLAVTAPRAWGDDSAHAMKGVSGEDRQIVLEIIRDCSDRIAAGSELTAEEGQFLAALAAELGDVALFDRIAAQVDQESYYVIAFIKSDRIAKVDVRGACELLSGDAAIPAAVLPNLISRLILRNLGHIDLESADDCFSTFAPEITGRLRDSALLSYGLSILDLNELRLVIRRLAAEEDSLGRVELEQLAQACLVADEEAAALDYLASLPKSSRGIAVENAAVALVARGDLKSACRVAMYAPDRPSAEGIVLGVCGNRGGLSAGELLSFATSESTQNWARLIIVRRFVDQEDVAAALAVFDEMTDGDAMLTAGLVLVKGMIEADGESVNPEYTRIIGQVHRLATRSGVYRNLEAELEMCAILRDGRRDNAAHGAWSRVVEALDEVHDGALIRGCKGLPLSAERLGMELGKCSVYITDAKRTLNWLRRREAEIRGDDVPIELSSERECVHALLVAAWCAMGEFGNVNRLVNESEYEAQRWAALKTCVRWSLDEHGLRDARTMVEDSDLEFGDKEWKMQLLREWVYVNEVSLAVPW